MDKNKVALIGFTFYACIIIGWVAVLSINAPENPNHADPPPATTIAQPIRVTQKNDSSGASFYRRNIRRTGVVQSNIQFPLKMKTLATGLNSGIHSASKSTPAVDDSGVYVGTDTGHLIALDHSGAVRWRYYFADTSYGIHSTPAIDGSSVFVGTYGGSMNSINKRTGELEWSIQLGIAIGSSPLIYEDSIIVAVEDNRRSGFDAFVIRLNRKTGEAIWTSPWLGDYSHSSPSIWNDTVVVGSNAKKIHGIDLDTGKLKWEVPVSGKVMYAPAIAGNQAYFVTFDGQAHSLDLSKREIKWSFQMRGRARMSPAVDLDLDSVIVSSMAGDIYSLEPNTGTPKWTRVSDNDKHSSSGLLLKADTSNFYYADSCSKNKFCLLDAITGNIVEKLAVPGNLSGSPSYYGNKIYLSLDAPGHLVVLANE